MLVTNCFSTQTSYENQTKKAINNRFIQQAMTAFFKGAPGDLLIENKDAAKIMEQVLINKRSRENAEKTRQSIKTNLQQKTDMANRVQKFIDCRSRTRPAAKSTSWRATRRRAPSAPRAMPSSRVLCPSAANILNCLKEDYPRIFKSDIIMDLMRVLGCGVEIKDKRIKNLGAFDLDNLNWNKVIICTDADVDGYHIRTLVPHHALSPGTHAHRRGLRVYRRVAALRDQLQRKTYFAYTELEKNGILKEIGDQKCSINRPRVLVRTIRHDVAHHHEPRDAPPHQGGARGRGQMESMFNLLLGNDEAGRKRHIAEHGKEYLDQLDLQ